MLTLRYIHMTDGSYTICSNLNICFTIILCTHNTIFYSSNFAVCGTPFDCLACSNHIYRNISFFPFIQMKILILKDYLTLSYCNKAFSSNIIRCCRDNSFSFGNSSYFSLIHCCNGIIGTIP